MASIEEDVCRIIAMEDPTITDSINIQPPSDPPTRTRPRPRPPGPPPRPSPSPGPPRPPGGRPSRRPRK